MPVCTIKRKEILDTISLLQKQDNFKCHNFTVTVEDLLRPEPVKVKQMYLLFLEAIYNGITERLGQIAVLSEGVDHPELYDDPVARLQFMACLDKALRDCGCDFQVSDLFEPTSKRTIRNLSALINYLRFTNYTFGLVDFDHYTEGKEEVLRLSDKLRMDNGELELEVGRLQHVREQEEETVAKLIESVQSLEQSLEELQAQKTNFEDELDSLVKQQEELADKQANREAQLRNYNNNVVNLEKKVVTCSPSKLRKEVSEFEAMVKDAIARNEEIGLSIDSYMKLVNCLQKLSPLLRGVGDAILAVTKKEEQFVRRQNDLETFKESLVREQRRSQELKQEIKAVAGRTQSFEQRLHQLTVKHKKLDCTVAGKAFQRDRDILKLEIDQMEKVKMQAAHELECMQAKMTEMVEEFQSQLQVIHKKREEILNACVAAHHATKSA